MLSITRMALSPIGKIISISATLPLIKVLGDNQAAWIKVMSIWAVLAFILLMLCFTQCKETVVIEARKKVSKVPIIKSLKCLFCNKYFWMAMTIWMMQCIIQMVTGTILPYYCKYIFHDDSLFSILLLCEVITTIVCTILFCPKLLKRFGKRNMSLIGVVVALVGHLIYCLNPTSFSWVVFSCIIRGIGFAPLNSVIFGFLGDVVEYGQWKFHVRQEGLIFSGGSVGYKGGTGITGAFITVLMSWSGYISSSTADAVQPQSAIDMIVNMYMYGMILIWVILLVVLFCYKLDKLYPRLCVNSSHAKRTASYKTRAYISSLINVFPIPGCHPFGSQFFCEPSHIVVLSRNPSPSLNPSGSKKSSPHPIRHCPDPKGTPVSLKPLFKREQNSKAPTDHPISRGLAVCQKVQRWTFSVGQLSYWLVSVCRTIEW